MFEFLFGWRKASQCKKLIRRMQCRLKLLRSRRESIIRQMREVIVQLIAQGRERCALSRVELLVLDQNLKDVYDLIDSFGEFIVIQMPYIRRHRDCPNDIDEAVSSLIFASARCGDLPELVKLRELFRKRYGSKFATSAVELLPGNLVNPQMIEKLCAKTVSHDVKFRLLKMIAKESDIQLSPPNIGHNLLQLEYHQEQNVSSQENALAIVGHDPKPHEEFDDVHSGYGNPTKCSTSRPQREAEKVNAATTSKRSMTILYLDEIEEFQPHVSYEEKEYDQRVFTFEFVVTPTTRSSTEEPSSLNLLELPAPRSKEKLLGGTNSGSSSCSHIHPNLPDYDDIVCKFMALKIEHQHRKLFI